MNTPIELNESVEVTTASSGTVGTFPAEVSILPEGVPGVNSAFFETPPEATIKHLESLGYECYLTQKGDLMVRSWQVGIRNFVSPEQVSSLQGDRAKPAVAGALEWLSENLDDLMASYKSQWIAIVENQVVAASGNLPDLMEKIRNSGIDNPFITEISSDPIVWDTAYVR